MFKHILVPLDGSTCAEQALPLAAQIARNTGAMLTFLHVLSYSADYPVNSMALGMVTQGVIDMDEQAAQAYFSYIRDNPLLKDIPVKTVTMYGTPPRTITDDAQLEHADLILMCSHRRAGLKHLVLGSVAQQVVRQSAIPVLILHEHQEKQSADEHDQPPFRILIALDGSAHAETVIQPAAELSALLSYPHPGNLHLMRVIRPTFSVDPLDNQTTVQTNKEAYDRAGDYLVELTRRIFSTIAPNIPLDVNFSVCCDDDVSARLLSVMDVENLMGTHPLSAIAVATHGRHGIPRWLLGSVTEDILRGTTLPVLVLRHVENEAEKEHVLAEASAKKQDAQEPLRPFIGV